MQLRSFLLTCAVATTALAQNSLYQEDGVTTYCWSSQGSVSSEQIDATQIAASGIDAECGAEMAMEVFLKDNMITAIWKIKSDFDPNNPLGLPVPSPDLNASTGAIVSVQYSNVHLCPADQPCDPIELTNPGSNPADKSEYTDDGAAFETQLKAPKAGNYTIFAHVTLAGLSDMNLRYDFAVYQGISIPSTKKDDGTVQASSVRKSNSSNHHSGAGILMTAIYIGVIIATASLVIIGVLLAVSKVRKYRQRTVGEDKFVASTPRINEPAAPWIRIYGVNEASTTEVEELSSADCDCSNSMISVQVNK
jgi:hypothetical protein